jgi:outer membrane protein TolC
MLTKIIKLILLWIPASFFLFCINGQGAQAERIELTLEQAIGLGLRNSSGLRSKAYSMGAAAAAVANAKAARYTGISASANYSHLFEQPKTDDMEYDFGSGPVTIPGSYLAAKDSISIAMSAQQKLFTFGKIQNEIKLAEEGMKGAQIDLDEEKRTLIMQIKRAFYGYLLSREVRGVQEQTLQNKQAALDIARNRYEVGLGTELEVLRAESDMKNFMPEVISARNEVEFAILAIIDLLDLETAETDFEIVLIGDLEPKYHDFKKEQLVERALEENYNLQQYRTGIKAAEYQEVLVQKEKLPVIAGFARYSLESGFDSMTGENKFSGEGSWSDLLTVGLSVQMPLSALFPWSGENARAKKADFTLKAQREGLSSLEGGIQLGIQRALLKLEEEEAKISSGKMQVELAQRVLQTSEQSFANGLISSTELKDAQLNLNAAQLGRLSAIYNYNMALYDLYDLVGVISIE